MSIEVDTDLIAALTNGEFEEEACSADTHSIYPLTECLWAGRSEFCEIVIARSTVYGNMLFLDKEIQSAEYDEAIYHEHLIHPVMAANTTRNKRVLIVGGGAGATAREVLKWGPAYVSQVAWVDIDRGLVDLCRHHLRWANDGVYNDPRMQYYSEDIRAFFITDDTKYDIIVLDLPDPDVDSLIIDRPVGGGYELYSREFFNEVRSHLAEGGSVVSHCGPIRPGRAGQPGLSWVQNRANETGICTDGGWPYHVCIPSFQGDWGFWMSTPHNANPVFPTNLRVMDSVCQSVAFTWPAYWH